MRKCIAILLALIMVLGMAACAAKAETPAKTEEPAKTEQPAKEEKTAEEGKSEADEEVTLTVWYYDDPGASEGYDLWAEQVHAAYPNITIEFEALPYDSGPEKFTVACATGTTPDLYFDAYSRCAAPISAGLTVDLTDLREGYADEFVGAQADGYVDGEYHAIITNSGAAYCLWINMDMVNEAGLADMLPADHLTWSYDQYLDFLRAIKEAYPDVYPMELFAGSQSSDMWYYSWLRGNGVELTKSDLSATAFNEGESREKALQTFGLFKTIIDEGLCNPGAAAMNDEESAGLWQSGKCAIAHGAFSNSTYWLKLQEEGTCAEFEYDAYAMPTYEGKEIPVSGSFGCYGFIAFDNGGHTDAIKKAISVYLENPECQTIVTNATNRMSVMTDTVVEYPNDHIADIMNIGIPYSAGYTDSSFGVLQGWWTEFRGTFYPNLQDFYVGNIDAGTLLDKWQAAGDAVISAAQ